MFLFSAFAPSFLTDFLSEKEREYLLIEFLGEGEGFSPKVFFSFKGREEERGG